MKYLSLFTGIGGFELGIQQAHYFGVARELALDGSRQRDKPNASIIVRDGAIVGRETNDSNFHARHGCKRGGFPTGKGYELCEGCQPRNHSEQKALEGIDTRGADLYLWGHWYCCESCLGAIKRKGIKNIYIEQAYEDLSEKTGKKQRRGKKDSSNSVKQIVSRQQPSCIGYSEIDKYAIQIFEKHFPKIPNFGDIKRIRTEELPNFDLVCGGFPCQSFSIAGKRGGFEDTRGTLFFDIARIVKAKRPRLLFLENVKGLLSHDEGRTFNTIILALDGLGYDLQWQVLNSKDFGAPQNRERVFIVGHLRGTSRPKVFPIRETSKNVDKGRKLPEQISNTLRTNYSNAYANETYIGELDYVGAVMSKQNEKWLEDGKELSRNFPQGQRVYSKDGIGSTVAGNAGGLGGKTGLYEIDKYKIRRLTPTECMRLQGFPDDWCDIGADSKEISDTQIYKMAGNAVTVNVIREIAKRLF